MSERLIESAYELGKRIMIKIKGGDVSNIDSFLRGQLRDMDRDIKKLHQNDVQSKMHTEQRIEELTEELEDNVVALEDIFTDIDPERIKTNEDRKSYAYDWKRSIEQSERKVDELKAAIKAEKESLKDKLDRNKLQVKAINARIDTITKKKS